MAPSTVPTTTLSAATTRVKPITCANETNAVTEVLVPETSLARAPIWSKMPVEASTVQISSTATTSTMPSATDQRKASFTADQKSMYTSFSRTCFGDAGFVAFNE